MTVGVDERIVRATLLGAYQMCGILLDTPGFGGDERRVVLAQADRMREQLEGVGVELVRVRSHPVDLVGPHR
jgi:hypothetical protein